MDEEFEQPPLEFANQVVQQFVDHLLGGVELSDEDYTQIRVTFRELGGSWFDFVQGDIESLDKLTDAVRAWAQLKEA